MNTDQLSPQGQARREAMLSNLQGAVRARRRRRRAIQAGVIALPLIALGAGVFVMLQRPAPESPTEPVIADKTPPAPGPATMALRHISFSEATTPATPQINTISDDELLDLLHAAGHNAGMIRRGSEVTLTGVSIRSAPAPAEPGGSPTPDSGA